MRGRIQFPDTPQNEDYEVNLEFVLNYYRLLAPIVFVTALTMWFGYSWGFEALETMLRVWILPIGVFTLISAAFVPWARNKLITAVKRVLSESAEAS